MNDITLLNKNYEKILDIIGEKLKTKKQIKSNRTVIIKLLSETFTDITADKLEKVFNLLYSNESTFKYSTIQEVNESLNKYSKYIIETNQEYKDHGYSMLLCGYFWLTRNFK